MTDEDPHPGLDDVAGWLFKIDRALDDVETTLADAGIITELRIPDSERIHRLRPGQPCLLYVRGRHPDGRSDALVIGTGTITGAPAEGDDATDETAAAPGTPRLGLAGLIARGGEADMPAQPTHRDVEVAIRPLTEPIHRGAMLAHAVLARSELFTRRDQPNPIRLTTAELDALRTTFDLTVEAPDIPLVRVNGPAGEPSFRIDADDGAWEVTRIAADGTTTVSTHPTATEATASISAEVAAIAERLASQVDEDGTAEDLEPIIVFDGGDGRELSIFKIAHRFAVFEVHTDGQVDPPLLGALDDIDGGMISLAGHLTGEHVHTHGPDGHIHGPHGPVP